MTRLARRAARAVPAVVGALALLVSGGGAALACSSPNGANVAATSAQARVQLRVLVLDDGQPMVRSVVAQLDREGVPYTTVDLTSAKRQTLTTAFLQSSDKKGQIANFQGVVAPVASPTQLSAEELSALRNFERGFGIRQVSAYNYPSANMGLSTPIFSGAIDGMPATVTNAAKTAGFNYLSGSFTFDDFDKAVTESYGYVANAATDLPAGATYTPFLTTRTSDGQTGSVMGVTNDNGFEDLVLTFAQNEYQQHAAQLGHGIVQWLTRGVHVGEYRNYFSIHVDDVFMADNLWSVEGNCTTGDGCDQTKYPEQTQRMVPADVTFLKNWQNANGVKLDMTFNGYGSDEYKTENNKKDPLLDAFRTERKNMRWLSHTYSHLNLSCVINENIYPEDCLTDAKGNMVYTAYKDIYNQLHDNSDWAAKYGFSLNKYEVVTGEHSGLKKLPTMTADNPNLAKALEARSIDWIASDASREIDQRAASKGALTVPRYPMNVFYNAATEQQMTSEYNWIYTSRANGGSGACEDNPLSTCIAPLNLTTGYRDYIVPNEVRVDLRHVETNDPRPHYIHQTNLTGDRIIYPVLDGLLAQYKSTFNTATTPIVNPTMSEAGETLQMQQALKANSAGVNAMLDGGEVKITNNSASKLEIPFTAGANTSKSYLEESYAGSRSERLSISRGSSKTIKLAASDPSYAGYKTPGTSALEAGANAAPKINAQSPTNQVPLVAVSPEDYPTDDQAAK